MSMDAITSPVAICSPNLGLLCEMRVGTNSGPGDLVTADGDVDVSVRVLGPHWTTASHVALYANGVKIREAEIPQPDTEPAERGVKWSGTWKLPPFQNDVFLVAVATGPGVREAYWPIPRPYQPKLPVWEPRVIGSTAPIWIDADGSGNFEPAFEYARRLVDDSGDDFHKLLSRLVNFDEEGEAIRLAKGETDPKCLGDRKEMVKDSNI